MTIEANGSPPPASDVLATRTSNLALSELRIGDVLANRFRIEALLGVGGYGVVYRARDLTLNVDVAVKLLRPELARRPEAFERFRDELLLARQVSSAHVVRIHDIAAHDGYAFISMDFVDGESLEHLLLRTGKLPVDEAMSITRGLLEGLAAAHQREVIHRDMKPANVLLDSNGQAFITDFGVARSLAATSVTRTGIIVGTPEYLSPEQARGEKVDARSDLYAVGLMLYEMLTGTLPFSGGTPAETVIQRIVRPPPSLAKACPTLPHWLHAFSDRLLKTNPGHRFATAKAALHALDTRHVPRLPLNRRVVVISLLLLALIAGISAWLWQHPPWRAVATQAARVSAIPRIAVLPIRAPNDTELAAVARAIDEHAQIWLRAATADASVPRRRVLDALARQTPGMSETALLRQLPEIASAAGANRVLHGDLLRDGTGLQLGLSLWSVGLDGAAPAVSIHARDAAGLFAAYTRDVMPLLNSASIHAGQPPPLPATMLVAIGTGLLALDRGNAEAAVRAFADMAQHEPANPIVETALLRAQQLAHQESAAQSTRDRILAKPADSSPLGRELRANALSGSDQNDAAMGVLADAVSAYPNDAELNLRYADALGDAGEGSKALTVLQLAVAADDQDARAWFLLGRTAIQQGHADRAVSDYLTHALVLNRLRGDHAAEAETINALGVGYERLGQLDAASQQYTQAAVIRESLRDDDGLAKSLGNLAIVQAVHGDGKSADATLDRVRQLLEKHNDRIGLANLYNDRGVVAEEQGAYKDALGFYRKALALRQELNEPALVAESLNNVGFSAYNLGDFDNALVFWQQALAQYQKVDDRSGELHIAESMGLLAIARGHFVEAREKLGAALQSAEDHQLPEEAAVAHTYLGQLALYEGRFTDSLTAARRGAEIFARRADQRGQAEVALLQANVAIAFGDTVGARKSVGEIGSFQLSSDQRVALLLVNARISELTGDPAEARKQLDAAATAAGDPNSGIGIRVRLQSLRLALTHKDLAAAKPLLAVLSAETTRLGEVPLRLEWLELEIAAALQSGQRADAASRYRDALTILKTVARWADAVALHRLGARALGDTTMEAKTARAAADMLQAQILADAPAAARDSLQRQLEERWRDEAGDEHG